MRRSVVLLFAVIAIDSALAIVSALSGLGVFSSVGGDNDVAFTSLGRIALGLLGLASVALIRGRPSVGYRAALAWAVLQIPVYVTWTSTPMSFAPPGRPNEMLLSFFVGASSSQSVNGHLASFSQAGVDLAGLLFAAVIRSWRDRILAAQRQPSQSAA